MLDAIHRSSAVNGSGKWTEPGRSPGTDVAPCFRVTGTG